ncbi:MAG: (4Fe-4S)-binding protein [Candidatus Delongbacteria bacterium]|nr:(4Fe-4S)-binding protein [Candidatus Delongbacteria bacterium]MBN2836001.1 (4Fe-4S)-binding protein [Candidatus Delongbacteria bacterium]
MEEKTYREYNNGEIIVTWQPEKCNHSEVCFRTLPRVFKPRKRPWVEIGGATSEVIIETVLACPSGALDLKFIDDQLKLKYEKKGETMSVEIKMIKNGPFVVNGNITIKDGEGNILHTGERSTLCRCGASKKMPLCDGNHRAIGFKDDDLETRS